MYVKHDMLLNSNIIYEITLNDEQYSLIFLGLFLYVKDY